jgi:preprotein translocase subunit SecD
MNRYPWWKYAILAVALLIGLLYTVPNFYGEAPAVQVSGAKSTVKVDATMVTRIEGVLSTAGVKPDFVQFDGNSVRARFGDTDTQIKAKDAIGKALNPDAADPRYIVALNLVSRSPEWMAKVRALPMYLGLDLRGGVHFLMQVDMKAALKQQVDTYGSEARNALREKRIRFAGITREADGLTVNLPEAGVAGAARDLLSDRLPSMQWTQEPGSEGGVRLVGRLSPQALLDIQKQALTQNIETLHKRVNELGVADDPAAGRGPRGGAAARRAGHGACQGHHRPHRDAAVPPGGDRQRCRRRDGAAAPGPGRDGAAAHRPEARRDRHRRAAEAGQRRHRQGPAPDGQRAAR